MQTIVTVVNRTPAVSRPGEIFAGHQDFAPDRRQKVIMQTAIDDLAPEKIHEDPGAAKENDGAQDHRVIKD